MSATSPSPASATTPQPPSSSSNSSAPRSSPSTTTSPPQPSSPPPTTSTSPPPSSLNADPPAPSTSSKPLTPSSQSPPPATPLAPPPPSPPPPDTKSPPSSRPPQASPATSPLPSEAVSPASPPPPSNAPRPFSPSPLPPPPPPPVVPPESSPPPTNSSSPPPSNQPAPSPPKSLANNSSPPPAPSSLQNSPPPTPATEPPSRNPPPPPSSAAPPSRNSSPPTPSAEPPPKDPPSTPSAAPPQRNSSPPTPSAAPPPKHSPRTPLAAPPQRNSSPPPASVPSPKNSPPPPAAVPPQSSFPPLVSTPSRNSPPPPQSTPPSSPAPPHPRKVVSPPASQPTPSPSNSTSKSSPSPAIWFTRPPSSPSLSPPSNSQSPATTPSENEAESSTSSGNTNGGIGTGGIVAISLVAGILVLALFGIAIWCARRQKKRPPLQGPHVLPSGPDSSSASDSSFFKTPSSAPPVQSGSGSDSMYTPSEPGGLGNSRSWFTYEELVKATNGFTAQNLLGEGGFGCVYKGCLPDGRDIAVKQLKIGGGQGEREFRAEVETISRIHHRHLVSLVGYCIQDSRRLLVYDYAPNNTLYFHLHGKGRPVLDWAKRIRIAAGAARGLAYLHEDCNPRIIHRDIKSSNILLDDNFEARVSDFGLARLALDADTHVTTRVMGTFGYLAPEYASSGKLTEKSDVFSFGVVLLELITGREPVDMSQPMGEESLVEWARPLLSQALENEEFELDRLTDPRLEKNYVESEMFRMLEVAAACVRHSATKRPNMGQVVRAFDSLVTSDLTNGMRPGQSEVFDSALQSEEIKLFRRMAFSFPDYSTDYFSPPNSNT